MTKNYTCPCCGKPYTRQDAEKLFMESFLSNDLDGIAQSNRMKIQIMHQDFKRMYLGEVHKLGTSQEEEK